MPSKFDKQIHCQDCQDDWYNHNLACNKELGCWHYTTAKLVPTRLVPNSAPPATYSLYQKIPRPSCYKRSQWASLHTDEWKEWNKKP